MRSASVDAGHAVDVANVAASLRREELGRRPYGFINAPGVERPAAEQQREHTPLLAAEGHGFFLFSSNLL